MNPSLEQCDACGKEVTHTHYFDSQHGDGYGCHKCLHLDELDSVCDEYHEKLLDEVLDRARQTLVEKLMVSPEDADQMLRDGTGGVTLKAYNLAYDELLHTQDHLDALQEMKQAAEDRVADLEHAIYRHREAGLSTPRAHDVRLWKAL